MSKFYKPVIIAAMAAMVAAPCVAASADNAGRIEIARNMYKGRASQAAFDSDRLARIERNNSLIGARPMFAGEAAQATPAPIGSFGPTSSYGDFDGPNGQEWFYTIDYTKEKIVHSEYYTELVLRSFVINVYDEHRNLVGTIKDDMHYQEGESRAVLCDVLPVLSKNFFNTDDKYEIAVGLGVNYKPGQNNYRTIVYQLGGEKDEKGNDKIIATMPDLVADVLDASTPAGEEIYMTIMTENLTGEYPFDKEGEEEVWEYFMAQKIKLDVYKKATATSGPSPVLTVDLPVQCIPGDQETVAYVMSMVHDGKPYMVFSRYGESFYKPYYSNQADIEQRETNTLDIDIYSLGDTPEKVQTTKIPVTCPDDCIAMYYSIGNFLYRNDVDFDHYDSNGKAAFIVTTQAKTSLSDETTTGNYYVYNPDGTLRATIAENVAGFSPLSDVPGQEPQVMIVKPGQDGYVFDFIDLYSCKKRTSFPYVLMLEDSDPDPMTTNLDRVPWGDSYRYAVELRLPFEEEDVAFLRVAWLDADGKYISTDEVNIGTNVYYAQCFINGAVLDGKTFFQDDEREYMVLIKRGNEAGDIKEELNISQVRSQQNPDGKVLLELKPDHRGVLGSIIVYPQGENPYLSVQYVDNENKTFCVDFYNLPLDKADSVIDIPADDIVTPDGEFVIEGSAEVYNLQGALIGVVESTDGLESLAPGAYILRSGEKAQKFIKK